MTALVLNQNCFLYFWGVFSSSKTSKLKNIYKHVLPVKGLLFFYLVCGICLSSYFIYLFTNNIFPFIWCIPGPLLSLALILTGLTNSKIQGINVNSSKQRIEIHKKSFFSSKIKNVPFHLLKSELKTGNGKASMSIPKLRLIILKKDKEIEELESNFLFHEQL